MRSPVVAYRHQEPGQRPRAVVGLLDGRDRPARAGTVVVRVAVQSLGYLAAEILRIFVQSAALGAGPHSSGSHW